MRTLAIGLAMSTALAFGALAQSQGTTQSSPTQSQTSPTQSQTTTRNSGAQSEGTSRNNVNIRANVRTGSGGTVVRERSGGSSVVFSRSRTRVVGVADERPSRITVIKKKKYAKKKRTRIYATAPASRTAIIEQRRRGVVVEGGVSRTRVISRDSGVRARVGVSTTTRSTAGSGSNTGSGSNARSGSNAPATGSGSTGTNAPAATPNR